MPWQDNLIFDILLELILDMDTPDRISEISLGMRRWHPCPAILHT